MSQRLLSAQRLVWLGLFALPLIFACGTDAGDVPGAPDPEGTPIEGDRATDFISHVPGQSEGNGTLGTGGSSASADGGAEDSDAAERAIAEADIIQKSGDLLYALSRYSGLSVVSVADPAHLRLVGNLRFEATPFEMYLEGSNAYVMFNNYGSYEKDEEAQQYVWVSTSRMQAIDVSDPADMKVLADQPIYGRISDSRKVGDIIYLVTHQNSWCWRCDNVASTRVTSFDASGDTQFRQVDQVVYQTEEGGGQRSVSVTTERAYVSGWSWSDQAGSKGTIDVVDISDPDGDLVKGQSVTIAGQIESRWQMEEENGVLRVISQPGGWGTTIPPVLETFRVESASDITALASLTMVLPRPEDLRSVRFDGDRAYAVTFERTDPLFTFDLSDPANPLQVGELEIPGWVYHMEPRGDRIYALGFDQDVDEGALHVSLFDVSDLSKPTMLDRVNFGGDWARFAEDQNRIHKAFNILESEGLILVPFSGSTRGDGCSYEWNSGIQLVDMTTEDLTLRGIANQLGTARRSLLVNDVLLGVSDHAVQTFDISDRDAPADLDQLEVARNISVVRQLGDKVLRFGNDWWTNRTILDVTTPERAQIAEPVAELDLTDVAGESGWSCSALPSGTQVSRSARWTGQVFVHGNYAYVPRSETIHWYGDREKGSLGRLEFFIVDLSDGTPKLLDSFQVDPVGPGSHFAGIVQTDRALLVGRSTGDYYYDPETSYRDQPTFSYDVIDLENPASPKIVSTLEVPSIWSGGGWGHIYGGCSIDMGWGWAGYYGYYGAEATALVSGDIVVSQHQVPVDDGTGRVRYYLDRIDVSDPKNPKLLDPINIPGNAVHYDHRDRSIVTLDYVLQEWDANEWDDCNRDDVGGYGQFDWDDRKCRVYQRRINSLKLVSGVAERRGLKNIEEARQVSEIAVTDERVFYLSINRSADEAVQADLQTLAIDGDGYLSQLPRVTLAESPYWWGSLAGRGKRAFISRDGELQVVNTATSPAEVDTMRTPGWSCHSLEVAGDDVYCAQGQHGVTRFELE